MLHAETISKKTASMKEIFLSLINSATIRTLAGWHPLLKALIRDEQAIESGITLFDSISLNTSKTFSKLPE